MNTEKENQELTPEFVLDQIVEFIDSDYDNSSALKMIEGYGQQQYSKGLKDAEQREDNILNLALFIANDFYYAGRDKQYRDIPNDIFDVLDRYKKESEEETAIKSIIDKNVKLFNDLREQSKWIPVEEIPDSCNACFMIDDEKKMFHAFRDYADHPYETLSKKWYIANQFGPKIYIENPVAFHLLPSAPDLPEQGKEEEND